MTASRRPARATVAGRAYLDLQNLARRQQRPTDELHQLYALEGFLARLSRSPLADRMVLKGGVLLAAYDARRRPATRHPGPSDRRGTRRRPTTVRAIAAGAMDDGLHFDTDAATYHRRPPALVRRTVATVIHEQASVTLAAELLGHTDRKVKIEHYIRRNEHVNPLTAELLDQALARPDEGREAS